ncbi:lipase [Mycobacterium sp. MS1601]|uniref:alpha/beta hydrolase n=1 Tax=Mycobacterium sp. MS1601 TaxID=1936029 RepID=UPI0009795D64|nr:alpha/beta hydrolase [Mycobacterium sp. MS1601]AQA05686.1 lipase [Mycobacterium sp. MS1601]
MPGLDPILQKVLDAMPFQLTTDGGPEAARARFRALPRQPILPEVDAQDRVLDGPGGPLPVRIYTPPSAGATLPVVVFFHGGGFAVGDLDTYDGTARQHAVGADAVVVSVDYRLAPEHPHPAAVDDAWAAVGWVAAHAAEFGADSSRLAVAGDSAGGNLAAVMAQLARDEPGLDLTFQLLWYPTVMWDNSLPSFTENAEAPILDLRSIEAFSAWYAGEIDPADVPATLAPGRAAHFDGLAPAYVAVAGHDPLRDDGLTYAELLSAAGVSVTVDHAETLVHGYLGFAGVIPACTEAMDRGLSALRAALHS